MRAFSKFFFDTFCLKVAIILVSTIIALLIYFLWVSNRLPAPAQIKLEINFSNDSISQFTEKGTISMKQGWASSEDWGIWALGDRASLSILSPINPRAKLLIFKIRPLISNSLPSQVVEIFIDQKFIKRAVLSRDEEVLVPLQSQNLWYKDEIQVDFNLQPNRPKNIGLGSDDRLLSIGLISAKFE